MYGPPRCRARTIERLVHGHGPICLAPVVHDHSCPGELALNEGDGLRRASDRPDPRPAVPLTQRRRPAGPANWAGNVEFRAVEVRSPRTVAGLRSIVGESTRVRALGTR